MKRIATLSRPYQCRTEFLFVDNNSDDDTVVQILKYQSLLPESVRVVVEERPGAAFARMRGFREAQGRYIACLDDDNFPRCDWLEQVQRALSRWPEAAAISGKIIAQTSCEIPAHIQPYLQFYAVIDRGDRDFCFSHHPHNILPPGAGLIVRRDAALQALSRHELRLAGPLGKKGFYFKGEDIELLRRVQQQGGDIWYAADLVIEHQLESERFEVAYLERFIKAIARPRHYHRMLSRPRYQVLLMTLLYGLNDSRKVLQHCLNFRPSLDWRLQLIFLFYLTISPIYTPIILVQHQRRSRPVDKTASDRLRAA